MSEAPVYPNPEMMLITPGGKPASVINRPIIRAVNGVCSAGLRTMVHPAAKAGPTFQHIINKG